MSSWISPINVMLYCRARGDMIEVFKILHGFYDNTNNITLTPHVGVATRSNKYKLYQSSVRQDLRKPFFTNRVKGEV